jgi:hypothetical protein
MLLRTWFNSFYSTEGFSLSLRWVDLIYTRAGIRYTIPVTRGNGAQPDLFFHLGDVTFRDAGSEKTVDDLDRRMIGMMMSDISACMDRLQLTHICDMRRFRSKGFRYRTSPGRPQGV